MVFVSHQWLINVEWDNIILLRIWMLQNVWFPGVMKVKVNFTKKIDIKKYDLSQLCSFIFEHGHGTEEDLWFIFLFEKIINSAIILII